MVGGGPGSAVGSPSPATVPVRRRCEGTAMGAVTLDLRPGLGVGPFTLGEFPPNNPSEPTARRRRVGWDPISEPIGFFLSLRTRQWKRNLRFKQPLS